MREGYLLKGSLAEGFRGLSDHLEITFSVNIPIKAPSKFRQFNTWKIHRIHINDFREDILNSDLIKHPHMTQPVYSVTSILIPC